MVLDPEKEPERWREPIVASSLAEAKRECQKRADEYEMELESITPPKRSENRPQQYTCNYKERE